jgi:hypothetical protein
MKLSPGTQNAWSTPAATSASTTARPAVIDVAAVTGS